VRTACDLDLGVHLADVPHVERALAVFSRIDTGEWPRFLILEDASGRRVDLAITSDGDAPERATGRIEAREVRCVALNRQLDRARADDAAALRHRFSTPEPRADDALC
jgi:hypothetical protein